MISRAIEMFFLFLRNPFYFLAVFFKTPLQVLGAIFKNEPGKFQAIRKRIQIRVALAEIRVIFRTSVYDIAALRLDDIGCGADFELACEKVTSLVRSFEGWLHELRELEDEIDPFQEKIIIKETSLRIIKETRED